MFGDSTGEWMSLETQNGNEGYMRDERRLKETEQKENGRDSMKDVALE